MMCFSVFGFAAFISEGIFDNVQGNGFERMKIRFMSKSNSTPLPHRTRF